MTNYNASTVKTLEPLEHMRQYPGMYIGSKDADGLHHLVKEIISNSIDEYLNGAGNTIIVQLNKDGSIYIEDNGRGIPHGRHKSGCSVLQACFGIANTGGKFDNATGETGYNTSGGEHGTGAKAVNALSTKLVVTTSNNNLTEIVEFSKGKFINYSQKECPKDKTGLTVQFYPDSEVLEETKFDAKRIKTMLQEFSFLCTGLNFIFNDLINNEKVTYYSNKGLYDFLNYLSKDSLIVEPFYFIKQEGKFQLEAIIGYTNNYTNITKLYTNNIPQEKGTHLTGFKTAWTQGLNQFARNKNLLKDKDSNLTGSDLEEGQIIILNFKMIDPVFKGQNKEELSSSEGRTYTQKFTSEAIKENENVYEKSFKIIFEKAAAARKARDAAKKARDKAREQNKKKQKALKFDSKLADCWSKDRMKCEIYVTEGDSASGNLKLARNNEFVAVMPVRGKSLNVRKATLDKIQKNAEIMTMIDAFGLTVDMKTMKLTYNKEDLRYGKIIIESDADTDGAHIKNLFYTFIWTFCSELILDGYVYAGVPPLYKITEGKDTYIYLKNDAELEEYRASHKGKKYLVNRLKGLGEMSPDETSILVDPDQRIIKQVTVDDVVAANKLFDDLMGDAVIPRKRFIQQHSAEATYGN